MYTQESIGKDRVGKDSQDQERGEKDSFNQEKEENQKHPHGTYQNVYLTNSEFDSLQKEYPDYSDMIENLSRKIEMKGYQYQNHFVTLKEWAKKDAKREKVPPAPPASKYDYEAIERASLQRLSSRKFSPEMEEAFDEFDGCF